MRIPFVIDNCETKLAEILNELLDRFSGRAVDIPSAYFNVGGFKLLRETLDKTGSLRLLLAARIRSGEDVGLQPDESRLSELFRTERPWAHQAQPAGAEVAPAP